ncbi:MAG: hypothetical protein KDD63_21115, partial [Bacteroidetes bacterium]|nr:hypothetical protein [Bacteroidota bacterium]
MKTFRQLLKGYPILVLLIFSSLVLRGQINETFSDGDFLQNPPWGGDEALFAINDSLVLQSNGMAQTEIIYLSTPNSHFGNTEWRIDMDYAFSPSTSNYIRIYLSSDQDSLNGPLNGYYLQVGESGSDDSYDLYRQDGNQSTLLIDGADGRASDFIHAQVKIRRTQDGAWSLFTDVNHTGNFFLEGTVLDTTYVSSAFFGIQVKHTASRKDEFFFDNIYVGEEIIDTIPPAFSSGWI